MPVSTTNGATLGTSATLPSSFDATGYNALTFTAIGQILNVGDIGKVYNMVTHQPLDNAYPTKKKGTYDIPNLSVKVGRITADAGQVLLQTALGVSASYAFKVTLNSGDVAEFTGHVIKAAIASVAPDGTEETDVEIAVDPESLFLA